MRRAAAVTTAVVAAAVLAAGTLAGLDATGILDRAPATPTASPSPAATPAPPGPAAPAPVRAGAVLPAVAPDAVRPVPAQLGARLGPLLEVPALRRGVSATVVDARTGALLYDRDGGTPRTPASVAKLATAAAVLQALGPDHRLVTRVVAGSPPGEVVLVGAGDPTLAAATAAAGGAPEYPAQASLTDLAAQVARALGPTVPATVTVRVDDSVFTGPTRSPLWPSTYTTSGVVSPVSGLSVDEGRRPGAGDQREPDPALAAGTRFAALLRADGLPASSSVTRGAAVPGAAELGRVSSPPLDVLVEQMLTTSDNDLAEALARLAAVGTGREPSFAGAADAVSAAVTGVRSTDAERDGTALPEPPAHLVDGSGLSRQSRVTSRGIARLLSTAVGPGGGRERALVTGLPVAASTGTLAERFTGPVERGAAGVVRAKTGTLTGVSALAGLALDADGRLLAFAFLADRVDDTLAARAALDRVAAAVAACGCAAPPG